MSHVDQLRLVPQGLPVKGGLWVRRGFVRLVASLPPWKFTVGLPGSSGGGASPPLFFLKLFCPAQASINVLSNRKVLIGEKAALCRLLHNLNLASSTRWPSERPSTSHSTSSRPTLISTWILQPRARPSGLPDPGPYPYQAFLDGVAQLNGKEAGPEAGVNCGKIC